MEGVIQYKEFQDSQVLSFIVHMELSYHQKSFTKLYCA